jgi:hypothetical protein
MGNPVILFPFLLLFLRLLPLLTTFPKDPLSFLNLLPYSHIHSSKGFMLLAIMMMIIYESLFLYTRNLIPGVKSFLHQDDDVVFSVQDDDEVGGTVEYRQWDPFKSRLAAAILSGDAQNILWIVSFVFVLSFCVFWLVHSLIIIHACRNLVHVYS